jgi:trigger factor
MNHTLQKEKDLIKINFEHSPEEIEKAFNKEYMKLAKNLKVNGFRPGKVPVSIAKNIVKIDDIKEKVLNNFIKEEVDLLLIEEEKYEDVEIEVKNFEYKKELITEVKYYFYPKNKFKDDNYLQDIKTINLKTLEKEITEEDIEKEIEKIKKDNIRYEEVEEINTNNVCLTGEFKIFDLDKNEIIFEEKEYEFIINEINANKIFESHVLKSKKNIDNEFEINYAEDCEIEILKNKKIKYNVLITKIQEGKIPVIDNEFIVEFLQLEEPDKIENLNFFFKEKIKEYILLYRQDQIDKSNYESIIDFFISKSEFEISDYVLKIEKEKIFQNFLKKNDLNENMSIIEFSGLVEKTVEETEKDFDEIARNKIMSYLILNEINKKEKIYEENERDDMEDLLGNLNEGIDEANILALFEKINNFQDNNKNEFSISKENINKTIKFLIDKINQELNIM